MRKRIDAVILDHLHVIIIGTVLLCEDQLEFRRIVLCVDELRRGTVARLATIDLQRSVLAGTDNQFFDALHRDLDLQLSLSPIAFRRERRGGILSRLQGEELFEFRLRLELGPATIVQAINLKKTLILNGLQNRFSIEARNGMDEAVIDMKDLSLLLIAAFDDKPLFS